MPVYWLPEDELVFPPLEWAEPNGLLAAGGDLSTERLLFAYRNGLFPWYGDESPILWWSPDPRFVLFPDELKVAKSMRPYFNQRKFEWTIDRNFSSVIKNCRHAPRHGQDGTWITEEMTQAYIQLHKEGYAHSVEVWQEGELVGGLYGIALGKIFFGESMFAKASNASKFGFIALVRWLKEQGFFLIDCQQATPHLASLGARSIPRDEFVRMLAENKAQNPEVAGKWVKGEG
jgi:leucyl/phenylalanyl-tRNA--protein transferase